MTRGDARKLQQALVTLHQKVRSDGRLQAEELQARREFFATPGRPVAVDATPHGLAEQRFLEWLLLERESMRLGAAPASALELQGAQRGLLGSQVGVYAVRGALGGNAEAQDLQDDTVVDLAVPRDALRAGDVVIGRLYPRSDGAWLPSAAIAVFRPGAGLAAAFHRDLERLQLDRRLTQAEIERLLLGSSVPPPDAPGAGPEAAPTEPLEHLEARLERLLTDADSELRAADVSQDLAQAERPGQVLGPLLDQLAFDTAIDLDAARQLLLEIWNAHHRGAPPPGVPDLPTVPGETLGERLVRTLDDGLAKKRDLGELFAQLEAMAGIEPDAEDDERNPFDDDEPPAEKTGPDAAADAPGHVEADDEADDDDDTEAVADAADGPANPRGAFGDLQPLVEEFLWEQGEPAEGPVGSVLRTWSELQNNAALPRTDLELVTGQDLMRVLLHVYLGAAPDGRAVAVRAAFAAMQRFYAWAQETQELPDHGALQTCRGALLEHLDRLQAAGLALTTPAPRARLHPGLLTVEVADGRGIGVRDDEGGTWWLPLPAATSALLQPGDLLLGALVPDDRAASLRGLVVVLPGDARDLVG